MRLIVANLDCETDFARAQTPGPHKALPSSVRGAIAHASLSLGIFASEGDVLWTLETVPGEDDLTTTQTPLHELINVTDVLPWGQTASVPRSTKTSDRTAKRWQDRLWNLVTDPDVAAQCNDRRLAVKLGEQNDWLLPDTVVLKGLDDLDHHIAHASLGPLDTWVAKAPFAASGRERLRRRGRILDGEARVRAERLLRRFGQLVVEPWMERVADFGCAGIVGDQLDELQIFAPHQLRCDKTGVFRGIRIDDEETKQRLGKKHITRLHEVTQVVGQTLHHLGYRGPFAVDSFLYQRARGDVQLHPLCEINARMTFGLVARAYAEKHSQPRYDFALQKQP